MYNERREGKTKQTYKELGFDFSILFCKIFGIGDITATFDKLFDLLAKKSFDGLLQKRRIFNNYLN